MAYAEKTSVSVVKTKADIEVMIAKYGAENFASFTNPDGAMIAFTMRERNILFKLPLPHPKEREFLYTARDKRRSDEVARTLWEQACRSRWRALFLCIKAKLESVEAKIETFDDAFLAHISIGGTETLGDYVRPQLDQIAIGSSFQLALPKPESRKS